MCSDDPFNDGVSDLVVDRLVVGAADEELILVERGEKTDIMRGGNLSTIYDQLSPALCGRGGATYIHIHPCGRLKSLQLAAFACLPEVDKDPEGGAGGEADVQKLVLVSCTSM